METQYAWKCFFLIKTWSFENIDQLSLKNYIYYRFSMEVKVSALTQKSTICILDTRLQFTNSSWSQTAAFEVSLFILMFFRAKLHLKIRTALSAKHLILVSNIIIRKYSLMQSQSRVCQDNRDKYTFGVRPSTQKMQWPWLLNLDLI